MARPTQIHRGKQSSFRRHYLAEWLAEREMEPMDLVNALNEASDMDTAYLDKSQVYRWLKGQLPQRRTQLRIAAVLQLLDQETGEPDPERLTTHPAQDWIARKFKNRSLEEIDRMKQLLELSFPDKTGTNG